MSVGTFTKRVWQAALFTEIWDAMKVTFKHMFHRPITFQYPREQRTIPDTHRGAAARRPTLLIADEPHHMGDLAAWGVQTRRAFDGARFRLLLSGTPFRSDNSAIPWVTYDEDGLSRADYAYGYPQALRDRVCRPSESHSISPS